MNPMTLLKNQHREVKRLFKQIEDTEDAGERRELLDQIAQKLSLHMSIEEEIFYPAVHDIDAKKAQESADEAYEEHHVVKLVLADLPSVDFEDERFEAKMTVLSELIEHHVEEEEKEMFKLAKRLGRNELESLGERMSARVGGGQGVSEVDDEAEEEEEAPHRRRRAS